GQASKRAVQALRLAPWHAHGQVDPPRVLPAPADTARVGRLNRGRGRLVAEVEEHQRSGARHIGLAAEAERQRAAAWHVQARLDGTGSVEARAVLIRATCP